MRWPEAKYTELKGRCHTNNKKDKVVVLEWIEAHAGDWHHHCGDGVDVFIKDDASIVEVAVPYKTIRDDVKDIANG